MKRWIIMALFVFALATVVSADPDNVSTSEWDYEVRGSRAADTAGQVTADGGNVSLLNVSNGVSTSFWQGLYGNATTAVVLNDGSSDFYSWTGLSPSGEIYFARTDIPNWGNVGVAADGHVSTEQVTNNMANSSTGADNLTNTISTATAHTGFSVGTNPIAGSPSTDIGNFEMVFLWGTDNLEGVYVGLVNQDQVSYDGSTNADFQVMLPTDGASTQQYYVYAELE